MTFLWTKDRRALRRASVPAFVRAMSGKHAELGGVVGFAEMLTIAKREHVTVRVVNMPPAQHGRLVRLWGKPFILVNRRTTRAEQTMAGMHELCHLWRDDPGVSSYYSDGETGGARDEFADVFAWYVTSPAREALDRSAPLSQEERIKAALRRVKGL